MGRLSKAALEKIPKNVDFPAKRAGVKSWKDEDRQGAPVRVESDDDAYRLKVGKCKGVAVLASCYRQFTSCKITCKQGKPLAKEDQPMQCTNFPHDNRDNQPQPPLPRKTPKIALITALHQGFRHQPCLHHYLHWTKMMISHEESCGRSLPTATCINLCST